jgi:hypothetical protein
MVALDRIYALATRHVNKTRIISIHFLMLSTQT